MTIKENIKKEALAAVAQKETTEMIRRYGFVDVPEAELFDTRNSKPISVGSFPEPLSEAVKQQALSAVGGKDIAAQIKLVKDNGHVFAPSTPSRETNRIAQDISRMHRQGHSVSAIHYEITSDKFGREEYGA